MAAQIPNYIGFEDIINFKYETLGTDEVTIIIRRLPKGPEVVLKKDYLIDREFAWAAGFYLAEGSKFNNAIGISNGNIKLVLRFRAEIDRLFNGNDYEWASYIRSRTFSLGKFKLIYQSILKSKVTIYHTRLASKDNIEMRVYNVVFAEIFHELIRKSIAIISSDKELTLEFLKGYEVGDGSINLRAGCLHDINITVKDAEVKDLFKNMFYNLYGIWMNERVTKGVYEISYCDVKGMINIILDRHFEDYYNQWVKLLFGFKNKEYVRSHFRYWSAISAVPLPVLKIAKKLNRSHWSVRDALNYDEGLGLVNAFNKRVNSVGPENKFYILSEKGRTLVNMLS